MVVVKGHGNNDCADDDVAFVMIIGWPAKFPLHVPYVPTSVGTRYVR